MILPNLPYPYLLIPAVLLLLIPLLHHLLKPRKSPTHPRATLILSVSPANHSPRALAHAHACLTSSQTDHVILIAESPPPPLPSTITFIPLSTPHHHGPRTATTLLKKLLHNTKALITALYTASTLPFTTTHIILNTPPALPALPTLLLLRHLPLFHPRPTLVIDWHNLAHTIMRTTGAPSSLTRLAAILEARFARGANAHWAVSEHLAEHLTHVWGLSVVVVYDRPRSQAVIRATDLQCSTALRMAYEKAVRLGAEVDVNEVMIAITSTSWTPDEDFGMLYSALVTLESAARPLLVIITGKGPLRDAFISRVRAKAFTHVAIWLAWLPEASYPHVLQAAHVGISLHASSSGLDLPMKAVDMLGAGLPVVALRYESIGELVQEGVTGILFDDASGLVEALTQLLFSKDGIEERGRMVVRVRELFTREDMLWQACWERDALPSLMGVDAREGSFPRPASKVS